jgi:hypothetical protein
MQHNPMAVLHVSLQEALHVSLQDSLHVSLQVSVHGGVTHAMQ